MESLGHRGLAALLVFALWLSPAGAATDRGLIWRAQAPGGETVAYLIGTVHLGTPDLYPLPETVDRAIAATDTLVLEIDPTGPGMADATAAMLQRGLWSGNEDLSDRLPSGLWREVRSAGEAAGIPTPVLARQKPWLAANSLLAGLLEARGWKASLGIELHLIDRLKPERPVIELESPIFQVELLSGLPETEQVAMLREIAADPDALVREMNDLVDAWQAGDTRRFLRLVDTGFTSDLTASRERLLTERNANMSERLGRLLLDGRSHLVAVGAAHLPGPGGIVERLRARGFLVEQQ